MDSKSRINKRRKLTQEGNYVTRSQIRQSGGVSTTSVISFRNVGGVVGEDVDGGRQILLTKTPSYKASLFYLAPKSSIGKKQIETGNKTVVVNTGLLFVSTERKGPGRGGKYVGTSDRYSAGQVLELKKGHRYTYSTGNMESELLIIESGDLSEKVLEDPLTNLDGAQQFRVARNPGIDVADLKPRTRMTREEREAFGQSYAAARGNLTPQEKRQIATDIARGKRDEPSHTVVGVNPTPIGDLDDDYIPDEVGINPTAIGEIGDDYLPSE